MYGYQHSVSFTGFQKRSGCVLGCFSRKNDQAYHRTVELLCDQPDTYTGSERLCFRCSRHCYNLLSADILRNVHLSLVVKAFRKIVIQIWHEQCEICVVMIDCIFKKHMV